MNGGNGMSDGRMNDYWRNMRSGLQSDHEVNTAPSDPLRRLLYMVEAMKRAENPDDAAFHAFDTMTRNQENLPGLHPGAVRAMDVPRMAHGRSHAARSAHSGLHAAMRNALYGGGHDPSQMTGQEMADAAWERSPTDAVGEAIETLVKAGLVKPPWDAEEQQSGTKLIDALRPQQRRR
jgi:hypothetical protein